MSCGFWFVAGLWFVASGLWFVASTDPAGVKIEDKLVPTTHPAAVMILMVAILSSSVNGSAGSGRSADPPPDMSTKTT